MYSDKITATPEIPPGASIDGLIKNENPIPYNTHPSVIIKYLLKNASINLLRHLCIHLKLFIVGYIIYSLLFIE